MPIQSINWGKLVSQGRAKAVGVSWTKEEMKARYELKIPAEFVRQGILTLKDYEKAKGTVPEDKRSEKELLEEAKKEGIAATPEATPEVLKEEIAKKKAKKEVKVSKPKARAKAKPKKK